MILGVTVTSVVGVILVVVGLLIWKKEKISLLHDYHYYKVAEKDKKAFCTLSGIGTLSIGVGLLISAVIFGFTESALSFIAFAIGGALGIFLLVFAGCKYNSKA